MIKANEKLLAKYKRIKNNQWQRRRNYLALHNITYEDYLKTDHWKDVRKRYWKSKLHNGKCYACQKGVELQLHHKTYRRMGNEWLNDFCLLCAQCHKDTHKVERDRPGGILFGAAKRLKKNLAKQRAYKP